MTTMQKPCDGFLGDRLQNGAPYAMGPLSVLSLCLSVTLVYCGQTVAWIKMPLGTEVGLGPVHAVLDGTLLPLEKGQQPQFSAHVYCGKRSPISAAAELL